MQFRFIFADPVANHLAEKQTGIDIRKTSLESDAESKRGKRRKKSEQGKNSKFK